MNPLLILVAATAIGVEAGWEPLADGGHLYTIQIEPELVRTLQSGNDLVSEVPAQVHVRSFRITLGTGALARIDGALPTEVAPAVDSGTGGALEVPASFDESAGGARPLAESGPETGGEPQPRSAEKPQLDANPVPSGGVEPTEPWVPLLVAVALLAASLGANLYLGWVAWDARGQYRNAVAKLRTAASA